MQLNAIPPSSYDIHLNQHQSHRVKQTSAEKSSASFRDLLARTQFYFILVLPVPAPPKWHILLAKHDCKFFSRSGPAPGRCSTLSSRIFQQQLDRCCQPAYTGSSMMQAQVGSFWQFLLHNRERRDQLHFSWSLIPHKKLLKLKWVKFTL